MSYPDIDKMFLEEISNHNDIIAMTSDLQSSLIIASRFGLDITKYISIVLECIQRKDFDEAAKVLTDAIYSIDKLSVELGKVSSSIKQGVNRIYEQESKGF